jgi:hypothetical protein
VGEPTLEDRVVAIEILRNAQDAHRMYADTWGNYPSARREVDRRRALAAALKRMVDWLGGRDA